MYPAVEPVFAGQTFDLTFVTGLWAGYIFLWSIITLRKPDVSLEDTVSNTR